jgi:hypothetical protein
MEERKIRVETDLVLGSELAHERSGDHDAGKDRGHGEGESPGSSIREDEPEE